MTASRENGSKRSPSCSLPASNKVKHPGIPLPLNFNSRSRTWRRSLRVGAGGAVTISDWATCMRLSRTEESSRPRITYSVAKRLTQVSVLRHST